jgi:hypothetical protein
VQKDAYLLELSRYIVLNPVRAGMVRSVKDWRWSNYRATAGLTPVAEDKDLSEVPSVQKRRLAKPIRKYTEMAGSRDEGIYLVYRSGGYTMKAISDDPGLHYSTVSKIIKTSENSRF